MLGRLLLIAILFLSAPFNVYALEGCDSAETQADMNICASLSYKEADKELNKIYKKALKIDSSEKFKEIQRSWLKYRDLNCDYSSGVYGGGTIASLMHAECIKRLTVERTEEIPSLFAEWK